MNGFSFLPTTKADKVPAGFDWIHEIKYDAPRASGGIGSVLFQVACNMGVCLEAPRSALWCRSLQTLDQEPGSFGLQQGEDALIRRPCR
jgi:hypothetical protein